MSFMTALAAASTVLGVVGAVQSANASAAAADYSAALADRDAYVADQNRKLTLEQARIDAEDASRDSRRVMAQIRATYGASGLALAGSPLDVLSDTATEQALDVRRIEYEGRARGREGALQAQGLSEQAELDRRTASSERRGGALAALGVGISGAGRVLRRTG